MQTERRLSGSGQNETPIKHQLCQPLSPALGMDFSETRYPSGFRMPKHAHDSAALSFVLAGGYSETVNCRERECQPLTTVLHPQGESHSVIFHHADVRIFRVEVGEKWHARMRNFMPVFDEPAVFNGGLLAFLAMRLRTEIQRGDCWAGLAIEGLMLEILSEFGRAADCAKSPARPHWIEEVREILHSRLTAPPSLTDLAQSVSVHPVHLAREFRRRMGSTIGDYVRRLRIEQACAALTASEAPMSEIALAAGFYDQSHFSNTFKKITGMTPAAWRAASDSYRKQ